MSHLFYVFFVYGEFSLLNDKMTNTQCGLDVQFWILDLTSCIWGLRKFLGRGGEIFAEPLCSPYTARALVTGQAGYAHVGRPSACLAPDLG